MRIKFKQKGQQKKFLQEVLERTNCPSLRSLLLRGFDISYSALKNYYNENRLMGKDFFEDLCQISGLKEKDFDFLILENSWGQSLGGKKSKRENKN